MQFKSASFVAGPAVTTRILVIDDDPIMLESARMHLSSPTMVVEGAPDGIAGLARLTAESFDLVLLDLHMPRLDGLGLLIRARQIEALSRLPIVMATSRGDVFAIDRAFELGATAFTTKPVNWDLLTHQLRYVLRAARTEEELRAARDRNAAYGEAQAGVLRIMRHELATPMNVILGFSRLLSQEIGAHPTAATLAEYNRYVIEASQRLNATLSDLQMLARLEDPEFRLQPDAVSLPDLLGRALHDLRPVLGETAGLVRPDPSLSGAPPLTGDPELFRVALRAVLANALTHGAPSSGASDRPCEIAAEMRDGSLIVTVRDHGPGMPPDILSRLSAPFQLAGGALDRTREGLGCGLALVRKIVGLHDGALSLKNGADGGVLVALALPIHAAPATGAP